jgi:hypothetical protein
MKKVPTRIPTRIPTEVPTRGQSEIKRNKAKQQQSIENKGQYKEK